MLTLLLRSELLRAVAAFTNNAKKKVSSRLIPLPFVYSSKQARHQPRISGTFVVEPGPLDRTSQELSFGRSRPVAVANSPIPSLSKPA